MLSCVLMAYVNEKWEFFRIYLPFAFKLSHSVFHCIEPKCWCDELKWKSRSIKDELSRKCLMNIRSDWSWILKIRSSFSQRNKVWQFLSRILKGATLKTYSYTLEHCLWAGSFHSVSFSFVLSFRLFSRQHVMYMCLAVNNCSDLDLFITFSSKKLECGMTCKIYLRANFQVHRIALHLWRKFMYFASGNSTNNTNNTTRKNDTSQEESGDKFECNCEQHFIYSDTCHWLCLAHRHGQCNMFQFCQAIAPECLSVPRKKERKENSVYPLSDTA